MHSNSVADGLDQDMPGPKDPGQGAPAALTLQSCERILRPLIKMGVLDNNNTGTIELNVSTAARQATARELAENSTVLLQNKGNLLPLSKATKKIVLVGRDAKHPTTGGGGSGLVNPSYLPSPYDSIARHLSAIGSGAPQLMYAANAKDAVPMVGGKDTVAIVFVSTSSAEGSDRRSLSYSSGIDAMVAQVAAEQPNTVVIAVTPGAVLMPWASSVASILMPFMPGQGFGDAIANILFGVVSPSGRLPLTMPNKDNEMGWTAEQWPGVAGNVT